MLKVGDKVRVVGRFAPCPHEYPIGTIRTIEAVYNDGSGVNLGKWACQFDEIEPVSVPDHKRCYLAGPMKDIPYLNFPAFHRAAAQLRAEGLYVFNPAEADIDRLGVDPSLDNPTGDATGFDRRAALAEDLSWIALNADMIALLPGWRESSGARAEVALAEALGLEIREL